jgi:hypothetical protein
MINETSKKRLIPSGRLHTEGTSFFPIQNKSLFYRLRIHHFGLFRGKRKEKQQKTNMNQGEKHWEVKS